MKRTSLTVVLAFLAGTGAAVANSQLEASVARELPRYGFADVDVSRLSTGQLAHINHLLHSNRGTSEIRGLIGAVLGKSVIRRYRM
ncbi:hypothetical protein [Litoreibacter roseus]|uniref:Uncharacterized protein n=1 Tax=Litoreibacter roseus TaxID=2601869 RepID=A0A6N6JIC0_9RHOB|nr:hypothetical protein [Litoreibacter roseus]GFE65028.1 hypothetical protein KIN_21020 [Litoreibacter roseus]